MFAQITDTETAQADLTVSISYRPKGGSWTTVPATYHVTGDYWYVNWVIPGGATPGLDDVKVDVSDGDGGSATATELGEYEVV